MTSVHKVPAQRPGSEGNGEIASELLEIVRALAEELHPHLRRTQEVSLDDDLDRDLGFDSLGRAELILRLDRAFKVRLPDHLLGDANSPRDLLIAVRAAGPARVDRSASFRDKAVALPQIEAPSTAATLIDVLDFHVRAHPDRPHLRVWVSEDQEYRMTYGDLHDAARKVAFGLTDRGLVPGDRVAIMLPTTAAFFQAFFGTLYAGGVPVPVYPPFRRSQLEDHLRRQAGILRNADASFLIMGEELGNVGSLLFGLVENLRHIETVTELGRNGAMEAPLPAVPQTMAVIQYTSGSTGDPKGVVLTHATYSPTYAPWARRWKPAQRTCSSAGSRSIMTWVSSEPG